MTPELDKTDRAILAALQNDGRMSNARLAETVGLSETPCARRLKRLENDIAPDVLFTRQCINQ